MQNRIEPPVLLSRLLMFVFAGTVVVLFVLFMTLGKMFPLNRPEVFFITTRPENSTIIQIATMPANDENMRTYERAFVIEYVRARNTVEQNTAFMRQKWGNADGGVIYAWSTPDVYNKFKATAMVTALFGEYPDFEFNCPVDIIGMPQMFSKDTYTVRMRYYCTYSGGQTEVKDYTIHVKLALDDSQIRWVERLDNPLGLRVSEYTVDGGADPLDTVYK